MSDKCEDCGALLKAGVCGARCVESVRARLDEAEKDCARMDDALKLIREERDEARSILATTADRLNTALRGCGMEGEQVEDPYRTLAIRDGIVSLYDRAARWRTERDDARRKLVAVWRVSEGLPARLEDALAPRPEDPA